MRAATFGWAAAIALAGACGGGGSAAVLQGSGDASVPPAPPPDLGGGQVRDAEPAPDADAAASRAPAEARPIPAADAGPDLPAPPKDASAGPADANVPDASAPDAAAETGGDAPAGVAAPETRIISGPRALGDGAPATFTFNSSTPGATFECRIDRESFASCASPTVINGVARGTHTFEVRAIAPDGAKDQSPAGWTWTYEPTPLCLEGSRAFGATGDIGPRLSNLTTATIELWIKGFVLGDPEPIVELSGALAQSSVSLRFTPASHLASSMITGRALAVTIDARGQGGALHVRGFDVDSGQAALRVEDWNHVAVVFTGSTQRAFVNGVELTAARQYEGSESATPAAVFGSAGREASLLVARVREANLTHERLRYVEDVRLSRTARYSSSFQPAYPLVGDGDTVAVWPIDESAGPNSAESSAAGTAPIIWALARWGECGTADRTPPETTATSGPWPIVETASASFSFTSNEPGSTFECRLDAGPFEPCTSPKSVTVLTRGTHTFEVRAVDRAGNRDLTAALWAWVYEGSLLCLDGAQGSFGRSDDLGSVVGGLRAGTVELWWRGTKPADHTLLDLHGPGVEASARSSVSLSLVDAAAGGSSLTGRALLLSVDARGAGGGESARLFSIERALPGFVETAWHHYAVTLTGATQRAFIDGVELLSAEQRAGTPAATFASAFPMSGPPVVLDVGRAFQDPPRFASGALEDLRISNTDRYAGPFAPRYPLGQDARSVALWPIDELGGDASTDISPGRFVITWSGAKRGGSCP